MKPEESFIGQPIRSLQTMLRIISESKNEIPTVVPDGIYGIETKNAITQFQRNSGLPATGITDQKTWEAVVKEFDDAIIEVGKAEPIEIIMDANEVFVIGESSPYLLLAQSMLLYLSTQHPIISRPNQNGMLDERTADSISSFQGLSNLPKTGNLDKKTLKYLSKQFTLSANRENIKPI